MNRKFRIALMATMTGVLGACGADEGEQGHAHDGGEPHAHEPAPSAAASDTEQGHAHGEDTHTHDGASDTQAFYGDEAAATEGTAAEDEHEHGDETHTHDEPESADDEAGAPDQN